MIELRAYRNYECWGEAFTALLVRYAEVRFVNRNHLDNLLIIMDLIASN